MASTNFAQGTVIASTWLNDVNTATYKADVNVKALAYGATGNGTTDDSVAIAAAITAASAAGGGTVYLPVGNYKISSILTIPSNVRLVGDGGGRVLQPTVPAVTTLSWYGASSEMIRVGFSGATSAGGSISNLRLDGRAIATKNLIIKDAQHGDFENLVLTGATVTALEVTNTDGLDPTGFFNVQELQIALRGGSTNAANGVYLNGIGTGASGVTKINFYKPRIEHANGHGLLLGLRADSNTFIDFFAYRANTTETGSGIRFESTSVSAVNTTNKFLGSTIAVGGISIALPSATTAAIGIEGTSFESVNVTELASDLTDRVNPFTGVGKIMGSGKTDKRYRTGFARLMNEHQSFSFDDFRFITYTNPLLTTNQGSWTVVRNGAGGLIQSALQPGGAVDIITGAAGTDDISIYGANDFTSGITLSSNPYVHFTTAPASTATVRHQWGLFGDSTQPDPTNGAYVQFDASVNANYQLICRKAGVSTAITTSIAGAASKRQWLICVDSSVNVAYFTKLATETQWTYLGIIATNVPIVNLLPGFRCRAQAAANRNGHIYNCEFGYDRE